MALIAHTAGPQPKLLRLAWPGLLALTPGLHAAAEVYMTREEALARAFPTAASFVEMKHLLPPAARKALEKRLGRRVKERG